MSDVIERAAYPEGVMKAAREAALAASLMPDMPDAVLASMQHGFASGEYDALNEVQAAARAILAERERCQRVAERLEDGNTHSANRPGWTIGELIAADIRKGEAS